MNNRQQIEARIARDKARRARKQLDKVYGTWTDSIKPEELIRSINLHMRVPDTVPASLRIIRQKNRSMTASERLIRVQPHGDIQFVFSIQQLLRSLQYRRTGVEWKSNVQRYIFHAPVLLKQAKDNLFHGRLGVSHDVQTIRICERGKHRTVHAVRIDCRVIQGAFCDSCLIPLTDSRLIHDNPASSKGKGVSFARKRVNIFLKRCAKHYGNAFYVMTGDYHHFFDSMRHADARRILMASGMEPALQKIGMAIIKMYSERKAATTASGCCDSVQAEDTGLTLGSQVSQVMALLIPDHVDHAVKDGARLRDYIRYMDDTLSCTKSVDDLRRVGRMINLHSKRAGLQLNGKKTKICKASKGVQFLQVRYRVTETGRQIRTPAKAGVIRMRRKLKKFYRMVQAGKMTLDHVHDSFKSWLGNTIHTQSYRIRKRMLNLYNRLFNCYRTKGVYA